MVAAADLAIERQQFGLDTFCGSRGALAGGGELIAARRAIEQSHAQPCLERVEAAEHRRKIDTQLFRCQAQRARACQRQHQWQVFTFGFAGTAGYFASLGLPAFTAYLVIAAEVSGGILLLANVATRWVALALLPILLGALWVHWGNGWVFSANGGGWEYPLFLVVVSVAVSLQAFAARAGVRQFGSAASPA